MKTSKNMNNVDIADLLRAVAAAYKIKDETKNKFKIIAYERAADAVEHQSSELRDIWEEGHLDEVPGLGKSLRAHLDELFKTGKVKHFESVMKGVPPSVFEFLKVSGVGPKKAIKLAKNLNIKSSKGAVKKLKEAAVKGKIEKIPRFGEGSQKAILASVNEFKGRKKSRLLISQAEEIANLIIDWMKNDKNTLQIDPLGSLRRKASTIGDVDLSIKSKNPKRTIEHFVNYPKKGRILEKGDRSASIIIPGNIRVDVMVNDPDSYGSLLQHFTGSKHHNIALREMTQKKGWSVSDYGIKIHGKLNKFADEKSFYKKLGMEYIEPELREDAGELEAAKEHKLPNLVTLKNVKGDLQIHSNFDIETSHDLGDSSMKEIVKKAHELKYEYIAFTEHNPSQKGHNNQKIKALLKRKKDKIDKLNYSMKHGMKSRVKKVFNSLEVDILPNGDLPLSNEAMELLDFALVSVHSSFKLPKAEMTKRVLAALDHPKVKIFAHPSARKLNERDSIDIDWPKIFEFCVKNNKWLEINADPGRLDLPDVLVHDAVKLGVKMTFGTDSHTASSLNNMKYGVFVARRGWAQKKDIVNTRSLKDFEKMLK